MGREIRSEHSNGESINPVCGLIKKVRRGGANAGQSSALQSFVTAFMPAVLFMAQLFLIVMAVLCFSDCHVVINICILL